MRWQIELSEQAQRDLKKLDKPIREKVSKFLDRLPLYDNPRAIGKPLKGNLTGRWRYRVGDYRIFCRIYDDILTIEAIKIGHRSKVYDD